MEVAAGTWCNKCMAPAQLAEQSLLLTSCCHIICENCVREMGDSYARDVTFCAACNADCRAATITRQNFASQSDEIQDVLAPRASEAILDQAMQRVARIESFKRQQFRDQIIVQQQQSAKHMQMLEHLRRDNEQLQQQYKQLRQENKRLARSSGGSRPMTSHSTGAEDGFFGQSASSRPRTQSAERSSRPRTQSAERSGRPHTSRTAGLVSAAPSSSPSLSTFARPHTRGGSSMKGSQLLHQTPPRRPYTPGDSAQSAVGQVLGGMSRYQCNADQSPGNTESHGAQRIDRFEAARGMHDVKSPGTASISGRSAGGRAMLASASIAPQGYAPSPAVSRQRPARFSGRSTSAR